jgi:hypothetical protein
MPAIRYVGRSVASAALGLVCIGLMLQGYECARLRYGRR